MLPPAVVEKGISTHDWFGNSNKTEIYLSTQVQDHKYGYMLLIIFLVSERKMIAIAYI